MYLNQVSNVHGHLVNLCVVKLLDILEQSGLAEQDINYWETNYL